MSGRQPTHTIWAVQKNAEKGFWTSNGPAWAHEDGVSRMGLYPRHSPGLPNEKLSRQLVVAP
jgi:hypothetical protein